MSAKPHDTSPRTLREARPGDRMEVRLTLFEFAEGPCLGLDLEEGDRLRCIERSPESILVAHANGTRVRVPVECARFVAVQWMDAPTGEREGATGAGEGLSDLQPPF